MTKIYCIYLFLFQIRKKKMRKVILLLACRPANEERKLNPAKMTSSQGQCILRWEWPGLKAYYIAFCKTASSLISGSTRIVRHFYIFQFDFLMMWYIQNDQEFVIYKKAYNGIRWNFLPCMSPTKQFLLCAWPSLRGKHREVINFFPILSEFLYA